MPENDNKEKEAHRQLGYTGGTAASVLSEGTFGDNWGEFTEAGGKANQFFDPLDLFGGQAAAAAGKAAEAQAAAALKAQKFLEEQYATLKGLQQPFIEGGQRAFGLQGALTGLQGQDAQDAAMAQFMQSQQGAINAGMQQSTGAASGGLMEGREGALRDYASNVAAQDYDNYYNNLGLSAGMGQAGASALGGVNVDQSRGIAQTIGAQGDARANGLLMQNQIGMQGISNLGTIGGAAINAYGANQGQQIRNQKLTAANQQPQYSNRIY